ncbi:MAG: hypothetical protein IJG84_13410 [Kiritimatiellae bacterium]|nr:hypothetical protein [Kiritimatiellia bacterium]
MSNLETLGFALSGLALVASGATVSDVNALTLTAAENVTLSTQSATAYPADIGYPVYWFDASETNGWTFSSAGDVTEIPSKVGTRSLQHRPAGATWDGWGDGSSNKPVAPGYVGGAFPYVDFEEFGSRKALVFNAVSIGGGEPTNALVDIGTVIEVTKATGAWMMGGGLDSTIAWHRGLFHGSTIDRFDYSTPIFHQGNSRQSSREATLRHNGSPALGYLTGWTGEWEVFSYCPLAANATATGIGVGDARNSMKARSGGQQIAEMLVFDRVLTLGEVQRIEAWLQKKWFARPVFGYNGYGRIGEWKLWGAGATPLAVSVSPSAGEVLSVDRIIGGFDGSDSSDAEIQMAGAGVFAPRQMKNWSGVLRATSGTLRLAGRPIPSLADLPSGCYLRFDVSDASSRAVDETGKIEALTNLVDRAYAEFDNAAVYLTNPTAARRPTLRENATVTGLPVADFGPTITYNGCYMKLYGGGADRSAYGVTTMIALIGGENDGGHILNGNFLRNSVQPRFYNNSPHDGLVKRADNICKYSGKEPTIPATNGLVVVDGIRRDSSAGLAHWGYQTVAIQLPGSSSVSRMGYYDSTWAGGLVLGEVFLYDRQLTEEEICDVQAYLAHKWLGKTLPGYAEPDVPAVQRVTADGDAAIDVPAGSEMRIGRLDVTGRLVKTGAGSLKVDAATCTGAGELVVREGRLDVTGPGEPKAESALADGAALHLDASRAKSMTTETINGTNFVSIWHDDAGGNQARWYSIGWSGNRRPFVSPDVTLNGLPVVDFGTYQAESEGSGNAGDGKGCYLHFVEPLESVRSVFIVSRFKEDNDGGPILGSSGYSGITGRMGFCRGSGGELIYQTSDETKPIRMGEMLTNGTVVASSVKPGTEFVLTELHPVSGVHASGLCVDRYQPSSYSGIRRGGQVVAEVVIYERKLSEREKVATRNYLMDKWFGREPEALPAKPAAAPVACTWENLVVDGAAPEGIDIAGVSVAIPQNPVVTLKNLPDDLADGDRMTLFTAASVTGAANLANASFVGETPRNGMPVRLVRRGGSVVAVFGVRGMTIIFK